MKFKLLILMLIGLFTFSFVSGASFTGSTSYSFVNPQVSQPSFQTYYGSSLSTYWPILDDKEVCEAREDILLQVAPGGCQPMVVRSDLLADQNVPVFCQIDALQINPLVDIKQIRNIRFTGKYPDGVSSAGFHPAQAALRTNDILLGSPTVNNIGYVVVVLKRTPNESALPDNYVVNLSAQLDYEAGNAYGIGKAELILQAQDDASWASDASKHSEQTFWQGRYSVRLIDADANKAVIALYRGDVKITSATVERGKTSPSLFLPGFYCQAGLQVVYDGFVAAQDKAIITISDEKGIDRIDAYSGTTLLDGQCSVRDVTINSDGITGKADVICGSQRYTLALAPANGKVASDNSTFFTNDEVGNAAKQYYLEAIKQYESLADDYPNEKKVQDANVAGYAEEGLARAIDLADKYDQKATASRLKSKFIQLYPDSARTLEYKNNLESNIKYNSDSASVLVNVGSRPETISLIGLQKPQNKKSQASANLVVGGEQKTLVIGETQPAFKGGAINITYIDDTRVSIKYNCSASNSANITNWQSTTLSIGGNTRVCEQRDKNNNVVSEGQVVSLLSVKDIDKLAKIRLIPNAKGPTTSTNLTVAIGIEKRAIQLSPKQTEQTIENLNKSIAQWEGISKNLGSVVTGLKTACFATAAVLTVKSFVAGASGEALARNQAMTGDSGWTKRCQDAISSHTIRRPDGSSSAVDYSSLTQCYNGEASYIDKEVAARTNALRDVNSRIESAQKPLSSSGLLSSVVDANQSKLAYAQTLNAKYPNLKIPTDEASLKYYSISDLRELDYQESLKSSNVISPTVTDSNINSLQSKLKASQDIAAQVKSAQSFGGLSASAASVGDLSGARTVQPIVYTLSSDQSTINGKTKVIQDGGQIPSEANSVAFVRGSTLQTVVKTGPNGEKITTQEYSPANNYLVSGKVGSDGSFTPLSFNTYSEDQNGVTITGVEQGTIPELMAKNKILEIRPATAQKFSNPILAEQQKVSYFGYGPYEGLPAIVPFDTAKGWYVRVNPVLGTNGQNPNYDKSGAPKIFDICNVGENGVIDDGKDECTKIYVGVNDGATISGLDSRESADLIANAKKALLDAASQKGSQTVKINGKNLLTGQPVAHISGAQCQEFMSPEDCKILFNMCDPVICPASRCNLGGKYPVDDVIQTGVVGSALLCLPNAKEGIAIPVCLTGIKAGIDGYLSILKSHRDCLSESLKTGQLVGICDQIYSIYTCDFFWRQFAPLASALLPKVTEFLIDGGQSARGGGEYLTVNFAWQNTQKSIDYFTQSYGVNSFKAFQARSIQDVGTEVCKGFISASAPTDFKTLVEPDSPPQFFAQFDSIRYSDATVPATAQYKVFYHIFAGNDIGGQYTVYLKNPPQSASYASTPQIVVDSGYIGRGQTVDKTRDLTAPEGYSQLCVRINGNEECGFKQVTTDFGLNYLRDSYASSQLTQTNIQTEQDCISGSPDASALLTNANLQFGAEEAVNPAIYKRGIIRVCATNNPGSSTNPDRYVQVGTCGQQNLNCWLDKTSVANAITSNNNITQSSVLADLNKTVVANLASQGAIVDAQSLEYSNRFSQLKGMADEIVKLIPITKPVSSDLLKVSNGVRNFGVQYNNLKVGLVLNQHKAGFASISSNLYGDLAEKLLNYRQGSKINGVTSSASAEDLFLRFDESAGWQFSSDGQTAWKPITQLSSTSQYENYISLLSQINGADKTKGVNYLYSLSGNQIDLSENSGVYGISLINSGSGTISSSSPTVNQQYSDIYTLTNTNNEGDAGDVSFRFDRTNNAWEWSFDKENWNDIEATTGIYGESDVLVMPSFAEGVRKQLVSLQDEQEGYIIINSQPLQSVVVKTTSSQLVNSNSVNFAIVSPEMEFQDGGLWANPTLRYTTQGWQYSVIQGGIQKWAFVKDSIGVQGILLSSTSDDAIKILNNTDYNKGLGYLYEVVTHYDTNLVSSKVTLDSTGLFTVNLPANHKAYFKYDSKNTRWLWSKTSTSGFLAAEEKCGAEGSNFVKVINYDEYGTDQAAYCTLMKKLYVSHYPEGIGIIFNN